MLTKETLHRNILVIYNPNAGKGKAKAVADKLAWELMGRHGIGVGVVFCASSIQVMRDFYAANFGNHRGFSMAVIIGGDGTIGPNVDAMLKNNINIPIYALGRGTANDFATYFKTNTSIKKAAKIIASGAGTDTDTIKILSKNYPYEYAVNVVGGGAFTNGVTKYSKSSKRMLGKFAYLIKAAFKSLTLKSQRVRATVDGESFEADIFLFYILVTKNVGGLKNAANMAHENDLLLDLVCIKKCGLFGKFCILLNLWFKRLHKSRNVIYKQGKQFKIETADPIIHNFTATDVDGNNGGEYPIEICLGQKITVFTGNRSKS